MEVLSGQSFKQLKIIFPLRHYGIAIKLCMMLCILFENLSVVKIGKVPHQLATDVPFIACVINLPRTFSHYLELSNF